MICLKCSTDNSEHRKFCRECGLSIANICMKCGFVNSLSDKYCGGCGFLLASTLPQESSVDSKENITTQIYVRPTARYTAEDMRELISSQSEKKDKKLKKKEKSESDKIGQNELDKLFEPEDSD